MTPLAHLHRARARVRLAHERGVLAERALNREHTDQDVARVVVVGIRHGDVLPRPAHARRAMPASRAAVRRHARRGLDRRDRDDTDTDFLYALDAGGAME